MQCRVHAREDANREGGREIEGGSENNEDGERVMEIEHVRERDRQTDRKKRVTHTHTHAHQHTYIKRGEYSEGQQERDSEVVELRG